MAQLDYVVDAKGGETRCVDIVYYEWINGEFRESTCESGFVCHVGETGEEFIMNVLLACVSINHQMWVI